MTERFNPIAPRLRKGEIMPIVPEGKIPTRYHGEIVFVSAPSQEDLSYGKSPYTERQIQELEGIRVAKAYLEDSLKKVEEFFAVQVDFDKQGEMTIGLSEGMLDYLDYRDLEPEV